MFHAGSVWVEDHRTLFPPRPPTPPSPLCLVSQSSFCQSPTPPQSFQPKREDLANNKERPPITTSVGVSFWVFSHPQDWLCVLGVLVRGIWFRAAFGSSSDPADVRLAGWWICVDMCRGHVEPRHSTSTMSKSSLITKKL